MGKNFTIEETVFPNLPQMMLATIKALKEIGGSASLQELDEQVVEMEGISEEEQSFMMTAFIRRQSARLRPPSG